MAPCFCSTDQLHLRFEPDPSDCRHRPLNQRQFRPQARALTVQGQLDRGQFLLQRTAEGRQRRLDQVLLRRRVRKPVLHGRLDQRQPGRQGTCLVADGGLEGGQFLFEGAAQRSDRLLHQRLCGGAVGKTAAHRSLDQRQFRLQTGGLGFYGRLDGGEFLLRGTAQRGHGLPDLRHGGLVVGQPLLQRRFNQRQLFGQRLVGTVDGGDDVAEICLHRDIHLRMQALARGERQRQQEHHYQYLFHRFHLFYFSWKQSPTVATTCPFGASS